MEFAGRIESTRDQISADLLARINASPPETRPVPTVHPEYLAADATLGMSVASVTAPFPAMNSRAWNGESSASACENSTFHGQQVWEMCRYNRFEIALLTGCLTIGKSTS